MLVIVSDLHLGDGTTSKSISTSAFQLFAKRLTETAHFSAWRKDGSYQPIENLDVILMGDILDPLHSTHWLDTDSSDADYVRPWSNTNNPTAFAVAARPVASARPAWRRSATDNQLLSTDSAAPPHHGAADSGGPISATYNNALRAMVASPRTTGILGRSRAKNAADKTRTSPTPKSPGTLARSAHAVIAVSAALKLPRSNSSAVMSWESIARPTAAGRQNATVIDIA